MFILRIGKTHNVKRDFHRLAFIAVGVLLALAPLRAQDEREIDATRKLFGEAGGVAGVRRGPDGRYYALTSRQIFVYDSAGKVAARIPSVPAGDAKSGSFFGLSVDVALDGKIYVADGRSGGIDVFSSDGTLLRKIPVSSPTSVAALPNGEMAVASSREKTVISVVDLNGKITREFGEPIDVIEDAQKNRDLNVGQLVSDPEGDIFYAFSFVPEPTFRKYDRFGYAALAETLNTPEFLGEAQYARRMIARQREGRSGTVPIHKMITAIGVDPETQNVWIAMENLLLQFNKDASEHHEYRAYTPESARLLVTSILVEPDRLILSSDTLGTYEFARPDKPATPVKADSPH